MRLELTASDGAARNTVVTTTRGTYRTPAFMPVGTRGAVRTLSSADLDALGAEIILANTYHLMLRPGAEPIAAMGGLHRFEAFDGHILTDSGGFQVFSLEPAVDDDAVVFRSTYDGSTHRFTPEAAVRVQERLGADIAMVLDVCPPLPAPREVVRLAAERTLAWATRARDAHGGGQQALFGIVQGGADPDLRGECARRTVALGFDGYGIGGLSVGESRAEMLLALAPVLEELPADRPRYLMGVGDPVGLVEAVALGVDQFDCVQPTRLGRHGTALTGAGRLHLKRAAYQVDGGPLDPDCGCPVCARWSRAYLRHLVMVGEPTAARLLTIHNLAWTFALMERIRAAIAEGSLDALRAEVAAVWEAPGPEAQQRVE
ncbi:MAG: tRNA guanosine(34) transglycosylase Tgt [Acidimicrobiales bacterium]